MKLIFLHADKHESFLLFLMENDQAFPKYQKQQVCNIFAKSQKKREE